MTTMRRRNFLKSGLGLGAGVGTSLGGALPGMGALAARAATGSDYKALVCIVLEGGMDGHDTLIPVTPGAYAQYADARQRLIEDHERAGDDSRARDRLIALDDGGAPSGFGMTAQMAPLAALYRAGAASLVANVGVLAERTDRAAVQDGRARMPPRLGSHNDQRSMWFTGALEGTSDGLGWGGEMAEAVGADSPYAGVTFRNESAFAASASRPPYKMHPRFISRPHVVGQGRYDEATRNIVAQHYRASAVRLDNLFATDFQNAQRRAVDASLELYDAAGTSTVGDGIRLDGNALSDQLAMVARMIAARGALGVRRQVFLVQHRGFDTHVGQAGKLPLLQAQLAEAMAAFYQETVRQGVADDVLTFTTAEFGRTLTPNADGTDHGWGNHHVVMGGGVRGGVIHGEVPEVGIGHDLDWDRGRWIPTLAVEQYAGGIGRWLGVPDDAMARILPRLAEFGDPLAL